jgi:hypothetical protein
MMMQQLLNHDAAIIIPIFFGWREWMCGLRGNGCRRSNKQAKDYLQVSVQKYIKVKQSNKRYNIAYSAAFLSPKRRKPT